MNEPQSTTHRTARDAYVENHSLILDTLDEIRDLIEDLPAPEFEGFVPNWAHVGDLSTYANRLIAIRDAIANHEV